MKIDDFVSLDSSLNGLQVGNTDAEIQKVAFAVDACLESFERAVDAGADLLFVHHGLFWGRDIRVIKSHYRRIEYLLQNHCALYAVHLPLDAHPEFGNNAALAAKLEMNDPEPFGTYHGTKIGLKGELDPAMDTEAVVDKLGFDRDTCAAILQFGASSNSSVGIVSGGAIREVQEAIDEGLDLYLTGEMSHTHYHLCLEEGVNLICGGHYQTETLGVSLLADIVKQEMELDTLFIDIPTGF
jgi:dinuclear metal center YbgI/SA1388 family protein